MVIKQAGPARWIVGGRADPGLVAAEIARGPQVPVPPGYWGVEVITGCGHRMARSGFTAGDVEAETGRHPRRRALTSASRPTASTAVLGSHQPERCEPPNGASCTGIFPRPQRPA